MDWTGLADSIWHVRWWFVPAFAALYLVPLLRIAGFAFECGGRYSMCLNRLFGMWEHAVFLPRDTLVTAYLAGGFLWHLFQALQFASVSDAAASLAALLLMAAGWAQRSFRRQGHLKLAEFVRLNPTVHPQEFFDHLLCTSGAVRHRLPVEPMETVDHAHLDFRNGRRPSKLRCFALAKGAWSTAWLAHILVAACDMREAKWVRRLASGVALIWAARVAQLMRTEVVVEGAWNLPQAGGPQIFLYTHASFIDFALAPLVLAARPTAARKRSMPNCTPSFLLAKDHFRDNPLYYRVLGIGKAAAALGMIFVERGEGGSAGRARRVVWEAAEKLVEEGMELGIYPQGTRAAPCVGVEVGAP